MKITKVSIKNFRQHESLDLDLSGPKGDLAVIQGRNSAGKTNFLNAIIWALYGELDASSGDENLYLTDSIVVAMEIGDYASCEVSLEVSSADGRLTRITRTQSCKKTKPTLATPYGASILVVQTSTSIESGWDRVPDGEKWVERNLPARFKPYFLFDGEKLATFFRDTDRGRIKGAIQEVAQIDVLDRMQQSLSDRSQELIQKAARQSGSNGEKLAGELESLQNALDSELETQKELRRQYTEAKDLEVKLDDQFASYKAFESNIRRKRQIDDAILGYQSDLQRLKGQLEERLRAAAPPVFTYPALKAFAQAVEDAKAARTLPPPIDLDYLKTILDKSVCICGADTSTGTSGHEHISAVINEYAGVSEVGQVLYEYAGPNTAYLAKLAPLYTLVTDTNNQIKTINGRLREAEEEQLTLATQLEGVDDGTFNRLIAERNSARSKAEKCSTDLHTCEAKISKLRDERAELNRQIEKLTEDNKSAQTLKTRAEFATLLAQKASEVYKSLNDQVREAVEQEFEKLFMQMIWNPEDFQKVGIDESYKVSVTNARGFEELGLMNAGHRLCLAFAFALTLSKTAGLNFPLVVDTPSGRLDDGVQEQLAQVLAQATLGDSASENHQLVLLMTSSEYNASVEQALAVRNPLVTEIKKVEGIATLVGR